MWVVFHLFCFAVLHKNLKKLEVLYVVTSLLVPVVIAAVPLVTHSYGLNPDGDVCNIYANTSVAFIERLALWDGPAMLMLIAASAAMVVMVIKLAIQVCGRRYAYTNQSLMATSIGRLSNSSFHWPPSQYCSSSLKYRYSCFMFIHRKIQRQMKHYFLLMWCVFLSGVWPRVQQLSSTSPWLRYVAGNANLNQYTCQTILHSMRQVERAKRHAV